MRQEIEFKTEDGTVLRGYLHATDGVAAPCIVMAHGFSGVKEQIDHYAAAFAQAGFSAIVYDHRGFGSSEGSPRLEVDPHKQISDWRDVITLAANLPEVDAEQGFGVWGSSYAGAHVLVVAAVDRRVKCVVSQVPLVAGLETARRLVHGDHFAALRAAFDAAAR